MFKLDRKKSKRHHRKYWWDIFGVKEGLELVSWLS